MAIRSRRSLKPVLGLLFAFLLLSLADLFLTWKLIHSGDGRVLESNPVANWWLTTYGWGGMAAFKLGVFLVVGGASGAIAFWRPRTSELLLVFACGAQSAVGMYSVLLTRFVTDPADNPPPVVYWPGGATPSPRGYGPASLPENGLLLLLAQKSVQEELGLPPDQAKRVVELGEKRQEVFHAFRTSNREEWDAKAQQLLAQEKALTDDLEPLQAERLRQISWQQRGVFAIGDPDVSEILGLTAEQKEKVATLVQEARSARMAFRHRPYGGEMPRRPEDETNRFQDQILAVLTAEQKKCWEQKLGEPFKGELRFGFGSPFGPGRDRRRPGGR